MRCGGRYWGEVPGFLGSPPPRPVSVGGVTLAAHRPRRRPGISFHSSDHSLARCLGAAGERSRASIRTRSGIELEVSVTGSIPRHTSTGRVSGDDRHERKRPRQLRHVRRNRDRGRHLRTRLFPPTHRTHNPLPRGPRTQKSLHTIYAAPKKCDTSRRDMSGIDNENIALTVGSTHLGVRQKFRPTCEPHVRDQRKKFCPSAPCSSTNGTPR